MQQHEWIIKRNFEQKIPDVKRSYSMNPKQVKVINAIQG